MKRSQSEFAVRAQAYQLHGVFVRFLVNQHQVWFDMTVAVILPVARKRMVAIRRIKRLVVRKAIYNWEQIIVKRDTMLAFALALVVTLELTRPLNRPHEVLFSVLQCC